MAQKKRLDVEDDEDDVEPGDQYQLIDVDHPLTKKIKGMARRYKEAQEERMAAGAREAAEKKKLQAVAKEAGVKPDANGVMRFRANGVAVTITPRDELVRVKLEEGSE